MAKKNSFKKMNKEKIIEVQNLTKQFGNFTAVKSISLMYTKEKFLVFWELMELEKQQL